MCFFTLGCISWWHQRLLWFHAVPEETAHWLSRQYAVHLSLILMWEPGFINACLASPVNYVYFIRLHQKQCRSIGPPLNSIMWPLWFGKLSVLGLDCVPTIHRIRQVWAQGNLPKRINPLANISGSFRSNNANIVTIQKSWIVARDIRLKKYCSKTVIKYQVNSLSNFPWELIRKQYSTYCSSSLCTKRSHLFLYYPSYKTADACRYLWRKWKTVLNWKRTHTNLCFIILIIKSLISFHDKQYIGHAGIQN